MTRGPEPDIAARGILLYMVQSPDPAFTTTEIADEFDKTRQWADIRLEQMENDGLLESKNPGGRSKFYWITEDGQEHLHQTRD